MALWDAKDKRDEKTSAEVQEVLEPTVDPKGTTQMQGLCGNGLIETKSTKEVQKETVEAQSDNEGNELHETDDTKDIEIPVPVIQDEDLRVPYVPAPTNQACECTAEDSKPGVQSPGKAGAARVAGGKEKSNKTTIKRRRFSGWEAYYEIQLALKILKFWRFVR